jgi:hypothetical protein
MQDKEPQPEQMSVQPAYQHTKDLKVGIKRS